MCTQYSHGYFLIYLTIPLYFRGIWASLVAQLVKNPPAMQVTPVLFLGWEDLLEKGRLPTPGFWPREFHGQEPGGLQSMRLQRVGHDSVTFTFKK